MTASDRLLAATTRQLKLRVESMDCSACAIKIENALKRLPGTSDISVNYGAETLALRVDEDRTTAKTVGDKIRSLGYTPHPLGDNTQLADEPAGTEEHAWWQTRKGRLVIVSAALLAAAFLIACVAHSLSFWAYLVAAAVGLVPIARRALAGMTTGTPFSIETLMTVAAAGAAAIGAVEEAAVVIFLFAVGELLENVAAGRARAGIKALIDVVPRMAQVEEAGQLREIPIERLRVGDTVIVRPGDRVASDGEVVEGASELDEAPITGE